MTIPSITLPELPVTEVLGPLAQSLAQCPNAVLIAPPGAGKTTLVPLFLLRSAYLEGAKILLVEPRRLAARAAARRMADLLGEEVGATIGWRMRLDTKVSARTRVEVVTEGVFTRMILDEPDLPGIGLVVFDEFHERSLDADFGLALALDAQGALRADLRLLVMSATLDGAKVASLLGAAPVFESRGRAFPVGVTYRDRPPTIRIEDAVAAAVKDALAAHTGSILVFLPGQGEIERVAEQLRAVGSDTLVVAPLYGALNTAAQDLAIRPPPPGMRKIVLATSIAETSITIEGVDVVIDSGLRRQPVFEPATGLSRLATVRVSRAAADQRAGRAGRTRPGVAIRLWRAEQTAALDAYDPPEILAADLSGLVLDCASWGVLDPAQLAFLDPPPAPALAEARALLSELGAVDAEGRITEAGRRMRALPLPPRLARMVDGAGSQQLLATELAVLLTERGLGGNDADLVERLRRWRSESGPRARQAAALARRIADKAGRAEQERAAPIPAEAGAALALAFPDRVAAARGACGSFVLANGRGGAVDPASSLAAHPFIVVADIEGEARAARIVAALPVSRESLEALFGPRIVSETLVAFDARTGEVRAKRVSRIGRMTLSEAPVATPSEAGARALADGIRERGLASLPFGQDAGRLLTRLRFLRSAFGPPWPDLSEARLLQTLDEWLMPFLPGVMRLSAIEPSALGEALGAMVPADLRGRIEALAPSHFDAPSGSRLPIRYEAEGPVLSARVQELFGLKTHPAVAGGRLPLVLELLSPAHRPIQITSDLPGFWAGSWKDVRSDLRGRYPRHVWPEDPASAEATARAKPRGS